MWLLALFIGVPLIEIALFIQVGGAIGLFPTLGVVILTAILGSWLVRSQGAQALMNLRRSFDDLRDPTEPLAHGAMILFSGALLLTPGFFTDAMGFALMVPGIRAALITALRKRIKVQDFRYGGSPPGQRPGHSPHDRPRDRPRDPNIIDGEYEEVEPKRPQGPSGWTKH